VANPSNRAENLENNIRPTSENLVFLDTVLLCQCPLGHGRHIVAVSIITIIRVLSTHHDSLLRALVSQQIFVPYPWASSISNKMVSQSWENDSARTNKKRSAANGMHKGTMRDCLTVPCWHSYHFFRTCQVRPGLSLSLGAPPLFDSICQ
jgi:hypothetical protein